ncbi:hypothetical protein MBLNU230_g1477t1 [Neophaeotheca triangularis]
MAADEQGSLELGEKESDRGRNDEDQRNDLESDGIPSEKHAEDDESDTTNVVAADSTASQQRLSGRIRNVHQPRPSSFPAAVTTQTEQRDTNQGDARLRRSGRSQASAGSYQSSIVPDDPTDGRNSIHVANDASQNPPTANADIDIELGLARKEAPPTPVRKLTKPELLLQRVLFGSIILALNVLPMVLVGVHESGLWVLILILFFKSKDFLSVLIQIYFRLYYGGKSLFVKAPAKKSSWILSLIPAYSESEEQIVKSMYSLRDNDTGDHKQVFCVILDGKSRPIQDRMTKIVASFERDYLNLKYKVGTLRINAGFIEDMPVICIEKVLNAGKKDSLVLCYDLFNYPRSEIDLDTLRLREEIWSNIIPHLTRTQGFEGFDLMFCTDADSTIHRGALAKLADACLADPNCIGACGFVYVEFEPGKEWSMWNLYQQFQYSFGQIVRRGAEHYIGKVTCLPGCITMTSVRPEMAGAISKYAKPVTSFGVMRHQVQYLGTDRRLTYSMLSQGSHLRTLFIPEAGSETVAPQSVKHYLSQRRRWGSNAYFNNYWYLGGAHMIVITRIAAAIEIIRATMVFYRVFNTALFLYGLATDEFSIVKLLPALVVVFTPTTWFLFAMLFLNKHLRSQWYKLVGGFCINRLISPFMSMAVFSLVVKNLGSQAWGMTGVTATNATAVVPPPSNQPTADEQRALERMDGREVEV